MPREASAVDSGYRLSPPCARKIRAVCVGMAFTRSRGVALYTSIVPAPKTLPRKSGFRDGQFSGVYRPHTRTIEENMMRRKWWQPRQHFVKKIV